VPLATTFSGSIHHLPVFLWYPSIHFIQCHRACSGRATAVACRGRCALPSLLLLGRRQRSPFHGSGEGVDATSTAAANAASHRIHSLGWQRLRRERSLQQRSWRRQLRH
jgi:hypothetical protein